MPPYYQSNRPENALKRCEDLESVGQPEAALKILHEVIMSKHARVAPLDVMEPILMRFVELCVALRRGKLAKEGLIQFKNVSQNTSVLPIDRVMKHYIALTEARLAAAQAEADAINANAATASAKPEGEAAVEDLETVETPETLILATVTGEDSKDRTDRQLVTPWLRFVWEVYRQALDILRNNARLEILYHTVSHQAFHFCLKYERKTEFRRLADLLRLHVTSAQKYSHQDHTISLNEPATLQRYLETRLLQLNIANELELWQLAFTSLEDIHTLFRLSDKAPPAAYLSTYYEKMARVFLVGGNQLFHAAALAEYYAVQVQTGHLSAEEHDRLAAAVLLAAISVPLTTASANARARRPVDDTRAHAIKLAQLLHLPEVPTRAGLIAAALHAAVVHPAAQGRTFALVKAVHTALEIDFNPLGMCATLAPHLAALMANDAAAAEAAKAAFWRYVAPLNAVVLTRLMQQLARVYQTVPLARVRTLAGALPAPFAADARALEAAAMAACRRGELALRIDHAADTLSADTVRFGNSVGNNAGPSADAGVDQLRNQLAHMAVAFTAVAYRVDDDLQQAQRARRAAAVTAARLAAVAEHDATVLRRYVAERKKEMVAHVQRKRQDEERQARRERLQREEDEKRERLEAEARQRQEASRLAEMEQIEKEQALAAQQVIFEQLQQAGVKIDKKTLERMSPEELKDLQNQQIRKEREDLRHKIAALARRIDYTERAYRKEELPLLAADYEKQQQMDRIFHDAKVAAEREEAAAKHASDLILRDRFARMQPDYDAFRAKYDALQQDVIARRVAEAEAAKRQARAHRIQEARQRKYEELVRAEQQREAEEAAAAEAERQRLAEEQAERERAEAEAKAAAERAEAAARAAAERQRLDEIAAIQARRDAEVEARML
ncbi:hypothetical protein CAUPRSCDRAFT_4455, partial [Caulochytrium protostelioides]